MKRKLIMKMYIEIIFKLIVANNRLKLPSYSQCKFIGKIFDLYRYNDWKALLMLHIKFFYDIDIVKYDFCISRNIILYMLYKAKALGYYNKRITPIVEESNSTYIVGRNPYIHNIDLFEALGGFDILEERWEINDIMNIIPSNAKIIFWNPWGNKRKLQLYNELKAKGYKVYVVERGALPDSVVFDETGLVIFSKMYDRCYWDKPIDDEFIFRTKQYLLSMKKYGNSLERQGVRSKKTLELKFKKKKYEKIILICLQLSSDTVVTQCVDGYVSYSSYLNILQEFAKNLPSNVGVMIKNHPLSKKKLRLKNTFVADKYHINDLIEISDCIVTYNSGTGIIARAFEKPVINFGPTSYKDDYFTYQISTLEELLHLLQGELKVVSNEKVIRYFSYLINEFYSFAKFHSFYLKNTKDARLIYPRRIAYYDIKHICCDEYKIEI